jgi:hypoxanthine phosphoribosyltransferase
MPDAANLLLSPEAVALCVERMAQAIAPAIDDDTVAVALLTGGLWFAADLTRALYQLDRNPLFDALWIASYGDAQESSGEVVVLASLQRPVTGRRVLLLDDVLDTGASLIQARRIVLEAGAAQVLTAVFARKPAPLGRQIEPDFVGWEAPARFLAGYGMDVAGRDRGRPGVAALD